MSVHKDLKSVRGTYPAKVGVSRYRTSCAVMIKFTWHSWDFNPRQGHCHVALPCVATMCCCHVSLLMCRCYVVAAMCRYWCVTAMCHCHCCCLCVTADVSLSCVAADVFLLMCTLLMCSCWCDAADLSLLMWLCWCVIVIVAADVSLSCVIVMCRCWCDRRLGHKARDSIQLIKNVFKKLFLTFNIITSVNTFKMIYFKLLW